MNFFEPIPERHTDVENIDWWSYYSLRELKKKKEHFLLLAPEELMDNSQYYYFLTHIFPKEDMYFYFSEHVKCDPNVLEIALPAIISSRKINYLASRLFQHHEIMLKVVSAYPGGYEYCGEALKKDIDWNMGLVQTLGKKFPFALNTELLQDIEFLLQVHNFYMDEHSLFTELLKEHTQREFYEPLIDNDPHIFHKKLNSLVLHTKLQREIINEKNTPKKLKI